MLREVFEGKDKQLSFMRVGLTLPILFLSIGIAIAVLKGDVVMLGACVAGVTALLIPKAAQSKNE